MAGSHVSLVGRCLILLCQMHRRYTESATWRPSDRQLSKQHTLTVLPTADTSKYSGCPDWLAWYLSSETHQKETHEHVKVCCTKYVSLTILKTSFFFQLKYTCGVLAVWRWKALGGLMCVNTCFQLVGLCGEVLEHLPTSWRKWVTRGWLWTFIACPYFLFILSSWVWIDSGQPAPTPATTSLVCGLSSPS